MLPSISCFYKLFFLYKPITNALSIFLRNQKRSQITNSFSIFLPNQNQRQIIISFSIFLPNHHRTQITNSTSLFLPKLDPNIIFDQKKILSSITNMAFSSQTLLKNHLIHLINILNNILITPSRMPGMILELCQRSYQLRVSFSSERSKAGIGS